MKFLAVLLLITTALVSIPSSGYTRSTVVNARGYSSTKEDALIQAKKNAVEQATGLYLNSKDNLKGDTLSSSTSSFTTGVVTSYKVISEGVDYIEIEATVVDKKLVGLNVTQKTLSDSERDQVKQLQGNNNNNNDLSEAVRSLDHVENAIEFVIDNLSVDSTGELLKVEGHLQYKKDWKESYVALKLKYGDDVFLKNLMSCADEIEGSIKVLAKSGETLETGLLKFALSSQGMLKRGVPNFDFDDPYTLYQKASNQIDSVEVGAFCKEDL